MTLDTMNNMRAVAILAVDFYNQTVCADGSTQTLATAASTDKNKTGGVLIRWTR